MPWLLTPLYRASFHSLLPSVQITSEKGYEWGREGLIMLLLTQGLLQTAQSWQRCLVSYEMSLCSEAHCHGTCLTPRAQAGFRQDYTDSGRAVHCWRKKWCSNSSFKCGCRRNTLLKWPSLAVVKGWELIEAWLTVAVLMLLWPQQQRTVIVNSNSKIIVYWVRLGAV